MRLITEHTDNIKIITEDKDGTTSYFIEGVFMQSNIKNRNGRLYPEKIMNSEVARYIKEAIDANRSMGELGHPEGPQVNLERVSHVVKSLKIEGDNIIGRAKVMDTPFGKIVKNLIDEGVSLGVSSRGVGSLLANKEGINEVQSDFMLAAIDIVADPSAPQAFVQGVMEGKEWVWQNGLLTVCQLETIVKTIKQASKQDLEEHKIKIFHRFLKGI